ncbi:hypothetical protein [Bacillus sp. JCM 19041]|uniref:hypothetical protein n=1 Tax=Bacillus sp. JCM 19041 TaxID=1460637 RepID=UPI000A442D45
MNQQAFEALGFHDILTEIGSFARTAAGKQTIIDLKPLQDRKQIEQKLAEVLKHSGS